MKEMRKTLFIISFRQARDAAKNGVKITNPSVLIDNLLGFPNNIELISNELNSKFAAAGKIHIKVV